MSVLKFVSDSDLAIVLLKIKDHLTTNYVKRALKTGSDTDYKVLSDNNLTDELVNKIKNAGDSTFSGNYDDLSNKPVIPSKTSELTNDSGFLSAHPSITQSTNTTSTATPSHDETFTVIDGITKDSNGHVTKYNTKTVTLPKQIEKTSELTNDSDFLTSTASQLAISQAVSGLISASDVQQMFTNLIGEAPEELDTLKEIADKLANSDSDVAALVSQLSQKVNTSDLQEITAEEINTIWTEVFV